MRRGDVGPATSSRSIPPTRWNQGQAASRPGTLKCRREVRLVSPFSAAGFGAKYWVNADAPGGDRLAPTHAAG